MLRNSLLYLSRQPQLFRFVRKNRFAKAMASRFVAGETVDSAVAAVERLNALGIAASLDLLGESVTNESEARAAGAEYVRLIDAIAKNKLDANVSVKLTAMGQDISDDLCDSIMRSILDRAQQHGSFVRLDMEGSAYTQRTLDFFESRLYPAYPDNVGIVLQSALRRTWKDVERAIALNCRVRLCKGAYLEPDTVAFPLKADVDRNYVTCMQALMERGRYPGIATHDPEIISIAKTFAAEHGVERSRFEFQMLYGVRRDLQEQLARDGYRLRVYVPFGTQWYPYLMRRLAERPANLAFITGNIVREFAGGRSNKTSGRRSA
jgi:proline dehydrogenase